MALFNGCVVTGPVEAEDLDSAVAWVKDRGVAFRVWVSEGLGAERAHLGRASGLAAQATPYPGMTLHPCARSSRAVRRGVTVVRSASDADGFDEFLGVLVERGSRAGTWPCDFSLHRVRARIQQVALFVGPARRGRGGGLAGDPQ